VTLGGGSNYPPGVTGGEDYFYPEECPECGSGCTPGEECPECGEYVRTDEDRAEAAAELQYDVMKEEGRL
jgi:hypothetical protein